MARIASLPAPTLVLAHAPAWAVAAAPPCGGATLVLVPVDGVDTELFSLVERVLGPTAGVALCKGREVAGEEAAGRVLLCSMDPCAAAGPRLSG